MQECLHIIINRAMIMKSMFVIKLIIDYLMLLDGRLQPGITSTVTE